MVKASEGAVAVEKAQYLMLVSNVVTAGMAGYQQIGSPRGKG